MSTDNNLTKWKIFKTQFNKVFKDLLSLENMLSFEETPKPSSHLKEELNPNKQYLKINVTLDGEEGGILSFLYDEDTATSIEYLMLMGFSDKQTKIEESTIDANQEFTQNLLDSVKAGVSASQMGIHDFNISEVSIVEDVEGIDVGSYRSFVSYSWEQQVAEDMGRYRTYVLMDEYSQMLLDPMKDSMLKNSTENVETEDMGRKNIDNVSSKGETDEDMYIVQIEDCDKRKTIFKEELDNLKLILNVELKLTVRIGTKVMLLKDIVNIDIGTTLELEQMANAPLDILINGIKIAEGEVVVVEGKFGIQIVNINSKVERLSKLKFKN